MVAIAKILEQLRNPAQGNITRCKAGALGASCLGLLLITGATMISAQQANVSVPADKALARLMEGNGRYARHKAQHPDEGLAHRKELEGSQHPFAVILSCSDSRVPPELIFEPRPRRFICDSCGWERSRRR